MQDLVFWPCFLSEIMVERMQYQNYNFVTLVEESNRNLNALVDVTLGYGWNMHMVFYLWLFCVCIWCCAISFVLMMDLHMFFPFDSILYTAVIDVKRMIVYASWSMVIRLVVHLITWWILIFKVLYELHKVYIDENNSLLCLELRIYLGLDLNCKAICVESQK